MLLRKGVICLTTEKLFDLSRTIVADFFAETEHPWEVLPGLGERIAALGIGLGAEFVRNGDIWIAKDARVAPTAHISGPCIIDRGAEIRHGAFIRGRAVIGKGCVVGNSTEIKNSLLFDGAQAPHFNYVGDSIMGWRAHIGAGVITGNVKCDRSDVKVCGVCTGMRKLGAMIGDMAEVGCGAVLCPGSIVGRSATVYPLCRVRGRVPEGCIYKDPEHIVTKRS